MAQGCYLRHPEQLTEVLSIHDPSNHQSSDLSQTAQPNEQKVSANPDIFHQAPLLDSTIHAIGTQPAHMDHILHVKEAAGRRQSNLCIFPVLKFKGLYNKVQGIVQSINISCYILLCTLGQPLKARNFILYCRAAWRPADFAQLRLRLGVRFLRLACITCTRCTCARFTCRSLCRGCEHWSPPSTSYTHTHTHLLGGSRGGNSGRL
jgi:hypothetical protein